MRALIISLAEKEPGAVCIRLGSRCRFARRELSDVSVFHLARSFVRVPLSCDLLGSSSVQSLAIYYCRCCSAPRQFSRRAVRVHPMQALRIDHPSSVERASSAVGLESLKRSGATVAFHRHPTVARAFLRGQPRQLVLVPAPYVWRQTTPPLES